MKAILRRIRRLELYLTPPMTPEITLIVHGVRPDGTVSETFEWKIPAGPYKKKRWRPV